MQFGIFTVGDVTHRPDHGPDADRARADQGHGRDRQEGRGGRARRRSRPASTTTRRSSPPRRRRRSAYIAAQTERHHPVDVDDADHHQRPGEDRRGLRDAAAPLRRPRRPDDGPRQHRPGLPVVRQGHPRRHPAGDRELRTCCAGCGARTSSTGRASSARRCRASPRRRARWTAYRRSSGTARSAPPRSPSRRRTTATASSPTTSSGRPRTPSGWSSSTAQRFEHYGHGTADQAIVGLGGQVFMRQEQPGRRQRVPPVLRQRAGLRPRPVAGGLHRADAADRRLARSRSSSGRSASASTSATTSASCSSIDHAGLPLKTVLEQLDLLGEEVVPVLRKEFDALRPGARAGRPDPRVAGRRRRRRRRRSRAVDDARSRHDDASCVVTAGLSQPSSTRLLADQLAAATGRALRAGGEHGRRRGRRAARPRARHHRQPAHRLPVRRAGRRRSTRSPAADARDRGDAGLQRVATAGCSRRSSTCSSDGRARPARRC